MPPMRNIVRKPIAKISGVENVSWPRNMREDPVEHLHAGRHGDEERHQAKNGRNTAPVVNMWWAQTEKPRAPMPAVAKMNAL